MMKKTLVTLILLLFFLCGAGGAYIGIGTHYQTNFFENTTINGIDVSDLKASEAEKLIAKNAEDYQIVLEKLDGSEEVLSAEEMGYQFVSHGEVQGFLEEQNFLLWLPAFLGEAQAFSMETATTYDEEKLVLSVSSLDCMQKKNVTAPRDAYVTQMEDGTYTVVPELEGNKLTEDKVLSCIREAIKTGETRVNLEDAGCYEKPSVTSADHKLQTEAALRNQYAFLTVVYQLGGGVTETLDGSVISQWFSLSEDNEPQIDRDAVAAWVSSLADQYDTIGACLPFVTTNGETVYPESRTYGWQMNREAETEALYEQLLSGKSAERSPIWYESARTRGSNDIGDTYVEIDYTNQRMWYYKDGALLVDTAVVTGNVSAGNASPEGVFCLVGKEENAVLVGEDYKTPVSYWMPFYGGVGIHDADSWRTSYGGDIYMYNGSHGCINTPTAQAAVIFQNIEPGTPIVCYSSGQNYGYSRESGGSYPADGGAAGVTDGNITIMTQDSYSSEEGGAWEAQDQADSSMSGGSGDQSGSSTVVGSGDQTDNGQAADGSIVISGGDSQGGSEESGGDSDAVSFPITIQDEWNG